MIAISHKILKTAMQGLGTVCTGKASSHAASHIMVCRHDGAVTLVACNYDLWMQFQIAAAATPSDLTPLGQRLLAMTNARAARQFMVPFSALKQALKAADPASDVRLGNGTVRYKLPGTICETGETFHPLAPISYFDGAGLTMPPAVEQWLLTTAHIQGIKDAMECASTDETRYVLNGAALCPNACDAEHGAIVATDGSRLALTESVRLPFTGTVIVPSSKAVQWMLAGNTWMQVMEEADDESEKPAAGLFSMQRDGWLLVGRTIKGTYPNFRAVIPYTTCVNLFLPPEAIAFILNLLPRLRFPTGKSCIVLEMNAGTGLTLHAAETMVPVPGTIATISLRIAFNPEFLATALRMGLGQVKLIDHMSPATFTDGGNRLYVLMPWRLPAPATETGNTVEESAEAQAA